MIDLPVHRRVMRKPDFFSSESFLYIVRRIIGICFMGEMYV